jgi:hypothetical protein
MSRQNIGDAALVFLQELDEFDITKDRSVLINALRDQFLITMHYSATVVEKARLAALEILIDRMPKMSENMLIKTIETLCPDRSGEYDFHNWFGPGKALN